MNIERRVAKNKLSTEVGTIEGYAALFNSPSEDLGGFIEIIQPGAFDGILSDDVRALFNHDNNLVLARTSNGTLKLTIDEIGLKYSFKAPDTTIGRDLLEMVRTGLISQSSFGFWIGKDRWEERNGKAYRLIDTVSKLFDVSPVTYPAYHSTVVTARSMEAFQSQQQKHNTNLEKELFLL